MFKSDSEFPPSGGFRSENTPLKTVFVNKMQFHGRVEGLQLIILLFVIVSFFVTIGLVIQFIIGDAQMQPHGGVASSSERCSSIGVAQLKKGGNAIDAAITTALCVSLVQPYYTGLGGGGFLLIHDHNNKKHQTSAIDFRETTPLEIDLVLLRSFSNHTHLFEQRPGLSIGVPGFLRGIEKAHATYGRLTWSDLFTPVIKLAEDGFEISNDFASKIAIRLSDSKNTKMLRKLFTRSDGQLYQAGDKLKRPDYAQLLQYVAKNKAAAFYTGLLAEDIVQASQENGGLLTKNDLKNYQAIEREALVGEFSGYKVLTTSAPSVGSLLIYSLNRIKNMAANGSPTSVDYLSALTDATRLSYRCRSLLGDPDIHSQVSKNEQIIINSSDTFDACSQTNLFKDIPDSGTCHISVIDKDEMLVSFTSSLNNYFGSGIVTKSGIILNDHLSDFASYNDPTNSPFNKVSAGARPLSSMVPTIVYHENRPCLLRFSIGGINGSRIFSSVAQTVANLVHFKMEAKEAVDSPKLFCNQDVCELEYFDGADETARLVSQRTGVPITVINRKLAGIGLVSKFKTNLNAYFDETVGDGKASKY